VGAGNGGVYATTDGGSTWSPQSLPDGNPILSDISCPTTSDCWAVGSDGFLEVRAAVLATTDGGSTWNTQNLPDGIESLNGVSCPTASDWLGRWRGRHRLCRGRHH